MTTKNKAREYATLAVVGAMGLAAGLALSTTTKKRTKIFQVPNVQTNNIEHMKIERLKNNGIVMTLRNGRKIRLSRDQADYYESLIALKDLCNKHIEVQFKELRQENDHYKQKIKGYKKQIRDLRIKNFDLTTQLRGLRYNRFHT